MQQESVKVMVRCRPMATNELQTNQGKCVKIDKSLKQIFIQSPSDKDSGRNFAFDAVFGEDSTQDEVYEQAAFQLVENVVQGFNGTIFAYGQTGSGKTHTMMGDDEVKDQNLTGLIPRTFQQIINIIQMSQEHKFLIRISYLELYKEQIRDLMSNDQDKKLELREHPEKGIYVQDLQMISAKSFEQMMDMMKKGSFNRKVAATSMNAHSSRSHSIFSIFVEQYVEEQGQQRVTLGKLNLVDLAGSERQKKTKVTGERLQEAQKINLSLLALSNVISALTCNKSTHIPYKDSKLTRLLQDSLGGNTKTVMIAAIAPGVFNYEETLSTLRYASRAKAIQNKPKINEDPKDALLRQYADEIQKLKEKIKNQGESFNEGSFSSKNEKDYEKIKKLQEENKNLTKEQFDIMNEFEKQHKSQAQLQELLKQYEDKITYGGEATEEQKQKYHSLQEKIKKQKEKEEKILKDLQMKEEAMLEMKESHRNLQEEATYYKNIYNQLRRKINQQKSEVEEIQRESLFEKQQLSDQLKNQKYDIEIYKEILKMILSKKEYKQVLQKIQFEENSNQFLVPAFYFKKKEIQLPNLDTFQVKTPHIKNEERLGKGQFCSVNSKNRFLKNQIEENSTNLYNKNEVSTNDTLTNMYQYQCKGQNYYKKSSNHRRYTKITLKPLETNEIHNKPQQYENSSHIPPLTQKSASNQEIVNMMIPIRKNDISTLNKYNNKDKLGLKLENLQLK